MGHEFLEKMKAKKLKNYLKIRGLKVTRTKTELAVRVFTTSENGAQPVTIAK